MLSLENGGRTDILFRNCPSIERRYTRHTLHKESPLMNRRTIFATASAALLLTILAACDIGEPTSVPGMDSERDVPLRSDNDAYTQHFVRQAIDMYESDGLDATLEYYNTQESVDGQWYVFIYDGDDIALAHAV